MSTFPEYKKVSEVMRENRGPLYNDHIPSDLTRAEVSALYSFGIPQEKIADYIHIDAKTLRKYYREELDNSATKANAAVGRFLFQNASGQTLKDGASHSDCIRAAMFWAKTRMGWRETLNVTGSISTAQMTQEECEAFALKRMEEIRAAREAKESK